MSDHDKPSAASKTDDGGPKAMTSVYRRFVNEQGKFVDIRVHDDAGALIIIMRDDRSCMENIITYREASELFNALSEALLRVPVDTASISSSFGGPFGVESHQPPKNGDSNWGNPLLCPPSSLGENESKEEIDKLRARVAIMRLALEEISAGPLMVRDCQFFAREALAAISDSPRLAKTAHDAPEHCPAQAKPE